MQQELLLGQKAFDWPNFITWVFQLKKKKMLCLIKSENIFGRFCRNMYTIKYQKYGLLYIYLLIFLNSANEFLETSYINEIIYIKLSIIKTDPINKLTRIKISIILHDPCRKINLNTLCISNTWDSFPR